MGSYKFLTVILFLLPLLRFSYFTKAQDGEYQVHDYVLIRNRHVSKVSRAPHMFHSGNVGVYNPLSEVSSEVGLGDVSLLSCLV